jgi:N,N'-diacetyllegionaminate synthase
MNFMDKVKSKSFYVIAEAADAHYGSLDRAKDMVVKAKLSGADAIKFQHHIPDAEMLPDIPMSGNMKEPLYEFLLRNALKIDQHIALSEFCKQNMIDYLCTPFSLKAALELENNIDMPAYKIGSGELLDHPTLIEIMKFEKPMIISTGMSTIEEIDLTYDLVKDHSPGIILMNCTSAYPPLYSDIHISFIKEMISRYSRAIIGFSDHSPGVEVVLASFVLGAKVIEKHVTLSHELSGPDQSVSVDFDDLSKMIYQLKNLTLALNAKKEIHKTEVEIRSWAHRSLVYNFDLDKGAIIKPGDIWGKRPGTGVPSRFIDEYIGRILTRNVSSNTLLSDEDFK